MLVPDNERNVKNKTKLQYQCNFRIYQITEYSAGEAVSQAGRAQSYICITAHL